MFFYGSQKAGGGNSTAPPPRADHLGQTVPGRVRYDAIDTVCRNNLEQIRQFITLARNSSDDDKPPASLDDARVPMSMRTCPVGHEAYIYDPATGNVHCPHPGHEGY